MFRLQVFAGNVLDRIRNPLNGHQTMIVFLAFVLGRQRRVLIGFVKIVRIDRIGRGWLTRSVDGHGVNVRCGIVQINTIHHDGDIRWAVLFGIVVMVQVVLVLVVMLVAVAIVVVAVIIAVVAMGRIGSTG